MCYLILSQGVRAEGGLSGTWKVFGWLCYSMFCIDWTEVPTLARYVPALRILTYPSMNAG